MWAEEYSEILELYSVGKSFEGRDIWQVTLTNKETGKDTDKPAMFIEGGRHSGEITSSESVLWLLDHILTNYGKDDEITKLVDTKTLYLKVMNNPDGSELYRQTAQSNRSTVRPHDTDRDGYSMRTQEMTWTEMDSSVKCARKSGKAKAMPPWIHGTRADDS